jgi:hypothetical protein
VIHVHAALGEYIFKVAIRQRIPEIPAERQDDDVVGKVPPTEERCV